MDLVIVRTFWDRIVPSSCAIVVFAEKETEASADLCKINGCLPFRLPYKLKRACRYPGCAQLTHTRYCPEHQRIIHAQYNKFQRDPETRVRYAREWRRVRDRYITEHPLCEVCKKLGFIRIAEEVHHILPLGQGGTHNEDNLMALCKSCHSSITAKTGGRWSKRD